MKKMGWAISLVLFSALACKALAPDQPAQDGDAGNINLPTGASPTLEIQPTYTALPGNTMLPINTALPTEITLPTETVSRTDTPTLTRYTYPQPSHPPPH